MPAPNWLILLRPARPTFPGDATRAEQETVGRHFSYLQDLERKGVLFCAGRTDEAQPIGIALFVADSHEAAQAILDADPAIRAGVIKGEVKPYRAAIHPGS